jgi:hypothetical protein
MTTDLVALRRSDIRNAYFAEDTDVILDAINQRLASGNIWAAEVLRELLNESLDELFASCK